MSCKRKQGMSDPEISRGCRKDSAEKNTETMLSTTQEDGTKSLSYINKLKHDPVYRHKFILSMILSWSFVCLGWLGGIFGPSFLDLRIITNTRLDKATFFMTAGTLGYLAGSFIGGVLSDKFDRILLVLLTVLANVFTSVAVPWCSQYGLMIAVLAIRGVFAGGQDVVGNTLLVSTWCGDQDGQSFMQGLHFAFAVGGILSPLLTAPFLAEDVPQMSTPAPTPTNVTIAAGYPFDGSNSTANMSDASAEHSLLYIPYSMTGGLYLTAAIPIFVFYMNTKGRQKTGKQRPEMQSSHKRRIPKSFTILVFVHLCSMFALYGAIEDSYINLLATFCVTQMQWTKVNSALVTSVLWAAFGAGRFSGIFFARFFKPSTLILFCSNSLVVSLMGFYISAQFRFHVGIWLFTTTTGFAMSVIFPCIFSWTESNFVKITGKVTSLFMLSGSVSMLNPIALGFLMDKITPMWFTYLLLAQSVVFALLFVSVLLISRVLAKRYGPMTPSADESMMETDKFTIYNDVTIETSK